MAIQWQGLVWKKRGRLAADGSSGRIFLSKQTNKQTNKQTQVLIFKLKILPYLQGPDGPYSHLPCRWPSAHSHSRVSTSPPGVAFGFPVTELPDVHELEPQPLFKRVAPFGEGVMLQLHRRIGNQGDGSTCHMKEARPCCRSHSISTVQAPETWAWGTPLPPSPYPRSEKGERVQRVCLIHSDVCSHACVCVDVFLHICSHEVVCATSFLYVQAPGPSKLQHWKVGLESLLSLQTGPGAQHPLLMVSIVTSSPLLRSPCGLGMTFSHSWCSERCKLKGSYCDPTGSLARDQNLVGSHSCQQCGRPLPSGPSIHTATWGRGVITHLYRCRNRGSKGMMIYSRSLVWRGPAGSFLCPHVSPVTP